MEDLLTKIIEKKDCNVSIEMIIGASSCKKALDDSYVYLQKYAVLDGFRKGKVPMEVIKSKFALNAKEESLRRILPEAISETMKRENLSPLFYPEVLSMDNNPDGSIKFNIKIEVAPSFDLADYKGLKLEKKDITVSDEEINNYLNDLLERSAKYEKTDDVEAKKDSFVIIDYVGKLGGIEFKGGKEKDRFLSIANNNFLPGFSDGIIGMKVGETKDIEIKFPDEYHAKDLQGKVAIFSITLKELRKKILSELNDDFVKKFGSSSLNEFKEKIRSQMLFSKEQEDKKRIEDSFVNELVEKNNFSIPSTMLKNETEHIKEQTKKYYEMYGQKVDLSKMEDSFLKSAEKNIKAYYILNEIIKQEHLEATEEEFDKKLDKDVEKNKEKFAEIRAYYEKNKTKIMHSISQEKVFQFLKDNAKLA